MRENLNLQGPHISENELASKFENELALAAVFLLVFEREKRNWLIKSQETACHLGEKTIYSWGLKLPGFGYFHIEIYYSKYFIPKSK